MHTHALGVSKVIKQLQSMYVAPRIRHTCQVDADLSLVIACWLKQSTRYGKEYPKRLLSRTIQTIAVKEKRPPSTRVCATLMISLRKQLQAYWQLTDWIRWCSYFGTFNRNYLRDSTFLISNRKSQCMYCFAPLRTPRH
jgi:hypothetical protein